jgi:hypothetical protein
MNDNERNRIKEVMSILEGMLSRKDFEKAVEAVQEAESEQVEVDVIPMEPEKKLERRVESDGMSDPPLSDQIMADLAGTIEETVKLHRGTKLNCMVIGEYTGPLAAMISDSFGGPGGMVLCMGDAVDKEGHPMPSWLAATGNRFPSSVVPVIGDIDENYQGMDRPIHVVLLSTCGSYSQMASLISRWAGMLAPGGVICGTQLDESDYPASSQAIMDTFGPARVNSLDSSFWWVEAKSVEKVTS